MNVDDDQIHNWAKKCGYTGAIPKDMTSFFNESTLHIWNEIITKVKPRVEVEAIRRKVLVHRLKTGMLLNEAMQKEYDIYHKLKTLGNFKEETLARITEKEALLKKSERHIRENGFRLENIKASNEAIEIKTFLIKEKMKLYLENITTQQSKFNFVENTIFRNKQLNSTDQKNISEAIRRNTEAINKDMKSLEQTNVNKLLRSHRNALFNEIHVSEKNLLQDLWNTIEICKNIISTSINDDKYKYNEEKFDLYAKCLEHDLETRILDRSIESLQSHIQNYIDFNKNKLSQNYSSAKVDLIMNQLTRQAKLSGLDVFNIQMKKKLEYLRGQIMLCSQNSKDLEHIREEFKEIKESMNCTIRNVFNNVEKVTQKQGTIKIVKRNSTTDLHMIMGINLDYLSLMENNIVLKELVVFRDYPIECHEQHHYGKSQFIRNTFLFNQPCSNLISEHHINPLQTPWELLTTIFNDIRYLAQLESTAQVSSNVLPSNMDPVSVTTDFKHNIEVVHKLVNDLNSAIYQTNLSEFRLCKQKFLQMLAEWLELKLGAFISPGWIFDGKGFIYYEEEFMRYYNTL